MIKKFIKLLLDLLDSGKLLKKPFEWLYFLMGILCFVPLVVALYFMYEEWDSLMSLLGSGFWSNFVTMFMTDLSLLVLVLYGIIGFNFWINRKKKIDSVVVTGSRTIAIPMVADYNQRCGEVNSIFIAFVPIAVAVLAFIACMLTNGFGFYTDWAFFWMIPAVPAVAAVALFFAYINVLVTRFFSEALKLLPQIGNDVQRISNGTGGTVLAETEKPNQVFALPAPTQKEKLIALICVGASAVLSFIFALYIALTIGISYNKSVFKELQDVNITRVAKKVDGFRSTYNIGREMAEKAESQDPNASTTFKRVTYHKLGDYLVQYYENSDFRNKLVEDAHSEYEAKVHSPLKDKIDAEKQKWEEFITNNDPSGFLQIETVTSNYRENDYWTYYDRPQFYFKYTEPKGKLKDASISYYTVSSSGRKDQSGRTINLSDFKKDYVGKDNERYFRAIDNSSYWNSHSMVVVVNSVTLEDGTVLKASEIKEKVPAPASKYINNPSEDNEYEFIHTLIDSDYPTLKEYTESFTDAALQKKNELLFDFCKKYR